MDLLTRHVGLLRSTARGPMSISLQQTTTTALATGWFPEKTVTTPEHWHWVHCQFNCRRRRRPLELVIPDISGEALAIETERANRYPAIRSLLAKCAGVMVLADAEQLQSGDHSQDFLTLKLLSLIGELRDEQSHGWRQAWTGAPAAGAGADQERSSATACTKIPASLPKSHAAALWSRLPVAVPATRGVRLFGNRRDRVSRQLRSAATGAAADRAARHHRAVWLVDDANWMKTGTSRALPLGLCGR